MSQKLNDVSDRTALRELNTMIKKGLLEKVGMTGRGTYYTIKPKTRHKPDKPDR